MLEFLQSVDQSIFLFINQSLANPVTDFIMPIITSNNVLRVGYAIAMILVLIFGNTRMRWMVAFSALTLLIADQLSANFLKSLFARERPCHVLTKINLLVNCGAGYAMPSAHAANAYAQAALWGSQSKKASYFLYSFAALVALSRVFVGVHYPFDITVGGLLGVAVGLTMNFAFNKFAKKVKLPGGADAVND